MSMLSLSFIVLYLLVFLVYWKLPDKARNGFLLVISWLYLASWKIYDLGFLVAVILISWGTGKLLARYKQKSILWSTCAIVLLLGILFAVKYCQIPLEVLGISFFTFQAISYVIDVYRGDVDEEKNFVVYALYVSFFPQLLSGPIAKAKEQLVRYKNEKQFDLRIVESGWILAIYGCFLKLVIADRIAVFVDDVYGDIANAGRVGILLAILLYSVQIYCDFAGYSLMALGIGRTFGIELPVNFRQPYLAGSMNDFWKRWHISLTSWFREYLYFPLGGNRKGKVRCYINILIVFVVSGIWHGAGMTFLLWGAIHGMLQVAERAFVKTKHAYRFLTYLFVSALWVLFRADTITQAGKIFKFLFINTNANTLSEITAHGLDAANIIVLALAMAVMTTVDIMLYRGKDALEKLEKAKLPIRWLILYMLIFATIVVGVYGPGYDAARFIYYKF